MYNTCECPYCGYENKIDDYEDDSFDYECSNCGEEFEIEVEYEPSFSASKIEYIKCDECGREERNNNIRYEGSTFPYPEKYEGTKAKLCHDCYIKGVFEDMEKESKDDELIKELYELEKVKEEILRGDIEWGN
ncbi:hypothetical protein [uncultured Clostridium sp.]|uniref:hypothetical protein n=1 Tax=uncultured Clostridium sp. TaxID=59620 RepID=UPI003217845E